MGQCGWRLGWGAEAGEKRGPWRTEDKGRGDCVRVEVPGRRGIHGWELGGWGCVGVSQVLRGLRPSLVGRSKRLELWR